MISQLKISCTLNNKVLAIENVNNNNEVIVIENGPKLENNENQAMDVENGSKLNKSFIDKISENNNVNEKFEPILQNQLFNNSKQVLGHNLLQNEQVQQILQDKLLENSKQNAENNNIHPNLEEKKESIVQKCLDKIQQFMIGLFTMAVVFLQSVQRQIAKLVHQGNKKYKEIIKEENNKKFKQS